MNDFRRLLKKLSNPVLLIGKIVILPVSLFAIFILIFQIHTSLGKEIAQSDISSFSDTAPVAPYPVLQNRYVPTMSAQAAIIIDDDSQVTIFEKNPRLRFSMASTTKIMTAIVALETYSLSDSLFIYDDMVAGSTVRLAKGEKYTLESLLYAMMLPSANDAAEALADNYPQGRDAFIKRMNQKAEELSLFDTKYDDPAGLEDDGNYTTAFDLASLASYALANETIAEIVRTKQKIITDATGRHVIPLENLNVLLGVNGIVGMKTGYTTGAGGVLVTARKSEDHTQIMVVMRSQDRFADTLSLVGLISGNLTYIQPAYSPLSSFGEGLTAR